MKFSPISTPLLIATLALAAPVAAQNTTPTLTTPPPNTITTSGVTAKNVYDIPIEPMEAADATTVTSLSEYKGKVLLIVNVASKCGYTKQYEGLEALYRKHKDDGLIVLGFPSNDFRGQEPGTEEEILEFCRGVYGVTFPLFAKVNIVGDDKSPLYQYLTGGDHPARSEVSWNFNKFLIDRNGKPVAHFDSKVTPEDLELNARIQLLLAQEPQ